MIERFKTPLNNAIEEKEKIANNLPMPSKKFLNLRKYPAQCLSEECLPCKTNIGRNIADQMSICLEKELDMLMESNEEIQRVLGYGNLDDYFSQFENDILCDASEDVMNECILLNKEIRNYETSLENLTKRLEQKDEKIGEDVWDEIKSEFEASVVSIYNRLNSMGGLS